LAEAVAAAANGDTIEVHGNGIYETGPIKIVKTALTIRAAEGSRPIIQYQPDPARRTSLCWKRTAR